MAYPYRIDATLGDFQSYPWGPDKLIVRGTDLYQALDINAVGPNRIGVRKSTDNGATWSTVGTGPLFVGNASHNGFFQFNTEDALWFAYVESTGTEINLCEFNWSTGWQTPITGGPLPVDAPAGSGSQNFRSQIGLAVRSNGEKVVIYSTEAGTSHNLKFVVYDGAWSAPADFLIAGTTDAGVDDYNFLALALGANDRLHVLAWSLYGYCYARIESDNSVTAYKRVNENSQSGTLYGSRYCWGAGQLVTIGTVDFAAFPLIFQDQNPANGNADYKPALWLFEDTAALPTRIQAAIEDYSEVNHDWLSVSVSQDPSTGTIYLAWTKEDPSGSADFKIRMSCFKGVEWSAPVTLFTFDWTTYNLMETMEITASDGIMRIVGVAYATGVYYWQDTASCSATSCSGGSGNINSVR